LNLPRSGSRQEEEREDEEISHGRGGFGWRMALEAGRMGGRL
jgi:hypothetical protein